MVVADQEHRAGPLPQLADAPGRPPPYRALDLIIGPLYWRLAVVRTGTPKGYLDRLAGDVAAALGAR